MNKQGFKAASDGFHVVFANGWTASVQWGVVNYADKKHPGRTVELAAWDQFGNWYMMDGRNCKGWASPEEAVKFLAEIAALPAVTKIEDGLTLTALVQAVEKWDKLSQVDFDGMESAEIGSSTCRLCDMFANKPGCEGCPVSQKTGRPGCMGSPWLKAHNAKNSGKLKDFQEAAGEMAQFLRELF